MFLIVEGPDGAGKSTLVDNLAIAHYASTGRRAHILKAAPPDPPTRDPFEEYEQQLEEYRTAEQLVICDRWHWGELIYGPLLRGGSRLDKAGWRHVEMFLQALGAVTIYTSTPLEVMERRLGARGDDLIEIEHLAHLDDRYKWVIHRSALPVIATAGGTRAPQLLDAARSLGRTRRSKFIDTYIGNPSPRLLLFGERRGGPTPHADAAAFVPRRQSSGWALLNHLPEDTWRETGICNALECQPKSVWAGLGEPPTIALGNVAHSALVSAGVPHTTVPHPQYVRRFHYGKLAKYGQLIADVGGQDGKIIKPLDIERL